MSRNKKILFTVVLVFAMLLSACSGNKASNNANVSSGGTFSITMPLGGTSGTFYIQGAALAEYLNKKTSKFRIIPTTSGGAVENIRLVGGDQAQMGMAFAGDLYNAWLGEGVYESELRNFRQLGPAQKMSGWNFIVLADSGINSVEDLVGKTFSPGAPGSGSAADADLFLKEVGILEDINTVYNAWGELPGMLQNGDIVGFNRTGGVPIPVGQEIDLTNPMKVLDLKPQMDEVKFLEKYPYFSEFTIPAGTYKGQEKEATTYGQDVKWIVHKDVPDEVVYEFMELAYTEEASKQLDNVYPDHNHRPEQIEVITPLHPAAKKFWEDKGFEVSEPVLSE